MLVLSQSGNPKGRPKGGLTSFDCFLEQELERMVDGDASLGDEGHGGAVVGQRTNSLRARAGARDTATPVRKPGPQATSAD